MIEHGERFQKAHFGPAGHWFEIYERPDEYPIGAKVKLLSGPAVVVAHDTEDQGAGKVRIALEDDK